MKKIFNNFTMKIIYKITFFFLALIFFKPISNCQTRYFYNIPNSPHSLKLKEKGDFSFSYGTHIKSNTDDYYKNSGAFGNSYSTYEVRTNSFQIGYNLINRLSISLNHDRLKSNSTNNGNRFVLDLSEDQLFHNSSLTGIGLGTYHQFKIRKWIILYDENIGIPQYRQMLLNLFVGYNKGKINNEYLLNERGNVNFNFQKYYVQGGVHWLGEKVELSYLLKFGKIEYLDGKIIGRNASLMNPTLFSIVNTQDYIFWENSLKLEFKYSFMGFYYQATHNSNQEFDKDQWNIFIQNLGVVFRIHDLKK